MKHAASRLVRKLSERLPVPKDCRDLGLLAAEFHTHCHRALELRPIDDSEGTQQEPMHFGGPSDSKNSC